MSDGLQDVFQELSEVCTDIAVLENFDSDEYNDIEDVRNRVDRCVALVLDHLGDRSERSSSTGSMTSSWVKNHAIDSVLYEEAETITENFAEAKADIPNVNSDIVSPTPSENHVISVSGATTEENHRVRTSTETDLEDSGAGQVNLDSVFGDADVDLDATIKPVTKPEDQEIKEDESSQHSKVNAVPKSTTSVLNPIVNPFVQTVPSQSLLSTMHSPVRVPDTRKKDTGHVTKEMMDIYGTLGGTPYKMEMEEWRMPPSLDSSADSLHLNGNFNTEHSKEKNPTSRVTENPGNVYNHDNFFDFIDYAGS